MYEEITSFGDVKEIDSLGVELTLATRLNETHSVPTLALGLW
jgi:hypothetical protein